MRWFEGLKQPRRKETVELFTDAGTNNSDGNGALMRNAPSFFGRTAEEAVEIAYKQAKTTHKGDDQAVCCAAHAFIGWNLVNGTTVEPQDILPKFTAVFKCASLSEKM